MLIISIFVFLGLSVGVMICDKISPGSLAFLQPLKDFGIFAAFIAVFGRLYTDRQADAERVKVSLSKISDNRMQYNIVNRSKFTILIERLFISDKKGNSVRPVENRVFLPDQRNVPVPFDELKPGDFIKGVFHVNENDVNFCIKLSTGKNFIKKIKK